MLNKNNFLKEINFLFTKLKIKKDDNILLHSNSAGINQIKILKKDKAKFYNLFINALLRKIGSKGTLVMPTYNYDFTKGKTFDYSKTICQVGELNNFFLKKQGVTRSYEPVFSHAIKGPLTNILINSSIESCFSKKSIFGSIAINEHLVYTLSCEAVTRGLYVTLIHL